MNSTVHLPDAALGQHIAVLGKTGSGKTFAIKGIVEGLLAAGKRVGIVDPTGAWWGLRTSKDGKGPGFPILVLGGDHGDLPLPSLGGAAVARLLVEQHVNLVADTSQLTVGERTRWFIDFASTLYRLNRAPLHLVLDEAHNFAPKGKIPDPDTGKMLHAANTLASGGRSRGIRLTMITQRPQKLHNDTLTSADTLIAMRVLAPHDRLAVEDWIKGCGDIAQGKEVLNSLASLERGEGWMWYPEGKFLVRTKFPPIRTFDSSATPTDGHVIQAPKGAAEIDLTEIKAALSEAVKEAEANDPKLLRKRIAELEAQGRQRTPNQFEIEDARRAGYESGLIEGRRRAAVSMGGYFERLNTLSSALAEHVAGGLAEIGKVADKPAPQLRESVTSEPRKTPAVVHQPNAAGLSRAERRALTALAQYPQGRTKSQVAILTGYAVNGGGFNNAISALRSKGYAEGSGDRLTITDAGLSALGAFDPLPHGQALLRHWLSQLGKAERTILEVVAQAYPHALSKEELGARTQYEPNGGGFNNALSRLRTLELIDGRGAIKASDEFFS